MKSRDWNPTWIPEVPAAIESRFVRGPVCCCYRAVCEASMVGVPRAPFQVVNKRWGVRGASVSASSGGGLGGSLLRSNAQTTRLISGTHSELQGRRSQQLVLSNSPIG